MSDLKDFLENIRKFSPKIGQVAMKHTSEHLADDPTVIGRKKKRIAPQFTPNKQDLSSSLDEDDLSAHELIDFSPIYRGLHISTVLGRSNAFETYYRTERTKQARLVLLPPPNMVFKKSVFYYILQCIRFTARIRGKLSNVYAFCSWFFHSRRSCFKYWQRIDN